MRAAIFHGPGELRLDPVVHGGGRPLDALVRSIEDMAEGRGSKYALVP